MTRTPVRPLRWLLTGVAATLLGCAPPGPGSLARIHKRGTLIVLTRNAPTTYYIGRDDRAMGAEYARIRDFAASLGVKPVFVVKSSVGGLLHALAKGEGDMIAAGLTPTTARREQFDFGPHYQQVTEEVVCRRGGPRPKSAADLDGVTLKVIADSSYVSRLRALKRQHPALAWTAVKGVGTESLLRQVWKGQLDCTVADSDIVAINRRYFPNLKVAFALSPAQPLAWVMPKGSDELSQAIADWMESAKGRTQLAAIDRQYYSPYKVFDYVDIRTYVRRIDKRYPDYRALFLKAAARYQLPPIILAAQAYQESHWNPAATSATGVRGMMMLTRRTAHQLGVKNRLNVRASIRGGAEYLAHLRQRLPAAIKPPDRIWFALAAYNVGLGHIRDACALAKRLGRNPDQWRSVAQVLPKLSVPRYYRTLKHGYARGNEPVRYIRRIRNYANILRFHHLRMPAPATQLAGLDDDHWPGAFGPGPFIDP
ncbi:membrane-bound lytic murein transglycosylase MltF [Oleiagrimonas sp. C23AA]|uniref:membrane-bound lytic murein transglycosylase MltF n=1 Tax=Oleiagrimonas sp. C23AA TaxID=2719047 RepID=UPI00141E0E6B|nr:membrane-bound lytic murein transglycosylase MltF [Oleiagrimonas sp. C23AA]NII09572.1 membrane-bound lytic murein transglycosylase MltF [Oleiagrimonas sp. C23AA]